MNNKARGTSRMIVSAVAAVMLIASGMTYAGTSAGGRPAQGSKAVKTTAIETMWNIKQNQ